MGRYLQAIRKESLPSVPSVPVQGIPESALSLWVLTDTPYLGTDKTDGSSDDLPEVHAIFASDLLRPDTCYACGQSRWWMDSLGSRKCGVCHPESGKAARG